MNAPHGCCTDGCDDIATARQIYLMLAVVLSAAAVVIAVFNFFYH